MTLKKTTPALWGAWAARKAFSAQLSIEAKLADSILTQAGLSVAIAPDGGIHRHDHPEGRKGNKRLWYACHHDFAVWGDWASGEQQFIFADREPDPETARRARQAAEQRSRERQADRERGYSVAARLARQQWYGAVPADPDHPYLLAKRVRPHGLRQKGDVLFVPLYADGVMVNLQRIYLNGSKRFLPSGRIKGAASLVGSAADTKRVYLCEGWATAATIHEETGYPVVAAMNCGNLLPVARSLRSKLAQAEIIIACDNDRHLTDGNRGITKGREAALAVEAKIVWPELSCPDCKCSDFNDLAACGDRKEVAHDC